MQRLHSSGAQYLQQAVNVFNLTKKSIKAVENNSGCLFQSLIQAN